MECIEIKQESDVEMMDENEDNVNFVLPVNPGNNEAQLQNSNLIVDMEIGERNVQSSSTSELMRSKEQSSSCTVVFVDTNALAISVCIRKEINFFSNA